MKQIVGLKVQNLVNSSHSFILSKFLVLNLLHSIILTSTARADLFMNHKGRECKRDVNIIFFLANKNRAKPFNVCDGKMMSGKIEIIFHLSRSDNFVMTCTFQKPPSIFLMGCTIDRILILYSAHLILLYNEY